MLDFYKLMPQIELVGQDSLSEQDKAAQIVQEAQKVFQIALEQPASALSKLQSNEGLAFWPIATPLEPFASQYKMSELKDEIAVIGTDGSQIMPNQHEVLQCYLLNIGVMQVNYGSDRPPLLKSLPYLFHKREHLYPLMDRRRLHIDELYVSLERNLLELEILCEHACLAKQSGLKILSLIDGSLLPWSIEHMPPVYQDQYVARISATLNIFKNERIPLFGYISNSKSTEVLNSMRILACPYEQSICKNNCHDLNEEDFPCSVIWPLLDRNLYSRQLKDSCRSAVFLSRARVSKMFSEDLQTCFFYCHTSSEIARLECPRWLFEDKETFHVACGAILAQVNRGAGYPLVLAEAHHLAVIKNSDRERFFSLLSEHMIALGATAIQTSNKLSRKRFSAV